MKSSKSEIRCISLDLDGTLINSDSRGHSYISDSNIEALREFCGIKNNHIVLATGRGVARTVQVFDELCSKGIEAHSIPFLICLNGAVIVDTANRKELVWNKCFSEDLSRRILEFLKKNRIGYFLVNSREVVHHSLKLSDFLIYRLFIRRKYGRRHLRGDFGLGDIQKIIVVSRWTGVGLLRKRLKREFGEDCYVSGICPFCLEITDGEINKFHALERVALHLGLGIENFAAMGNEQNDVKSLENVGFGVGINLDGSVVCDKSKIGLNLIDKSGSGVADAIYEMRKRGLW